MRPERKRIRLPRELYRRTGSLISVTVGTDSRRDVFVDDSLTSSSIKLLEEQSREMNVAILAFCFMPDHLHLLARLNADGDLVDFMRDFKSRSTRVYWNHGFAGKVWQRSFYDHIVRESDDPMKHVRYVLENPVRAGIVDSFDKYPFCGSFVFEVMEPELWERGFDW